MRVEAGLVRQALHPVDAHILQRLDLAGVVGQQTQRLDLQMFKHRLEDAVVAHVSTKTESLVGFYRICAAVLQFVSFDLVQQANAPPFLAQIKYRTASGESDLVQGRLQLRSTVAAQDRKSVV